MHSLSEFWPLENELSGPTLEDIQNLCNIRYLFNNKLGDALLSKEIFISPTPEVDLHLKQMVFSIKRIEGA